MAILAICCLWIVTDVAYGVRMWELGVDAWIGRIKALTIILIGVSLSYLFFNYLVNTFLDRNKERRSRPVFREYLWVVLFNLVVLNIGLYRDLFYKWNDLSVGRGVNDQCGSCADLSPILFLDP